MSPGGLGVSDMSCYGLVNQPKIIVRFHSAVKPVNTVSTIRLVCRKVYSVGFYEFKVSSVKLSVSKREQSSTKHAQNPLFNDGSPDKQWLFQTSVVQLVYDTKT